MRQKRSFGRILSLERMICMVSLLISYFVLWFCSFPSGSSVPVCQRVITFRDARALEPAAAPCCSEAAELAGGVTYWEGVPVCRVKLRQCK